MKYLVIIVTGLFSINLFATGNEIKAVTYNTGIAHTYVPKAKERIPLIIDALKKLDVDILCLQEVWTEEDRLRIAQELKNQFPFQFYSEVKNIKSQRQPTCFPWELLGEGKFLGCMLNQCGGKKDDAFTTCILNDCHKPLDDLKKSNRECATSLLSQVGKSSARAFLTIINPLWSAGLYVFEGSDGLMLLSKKKFTSKNYIDYTQISTLIKRAVLEVEIQNQDKNVKVLCTHLTAQLSKTPYTGIQESWDAENLMQSKRLLSTVSKYPNVILLGDFNFGPKIENLGLSGELLDSFSLFQESKDLQRNTFAENETGCTYCKENSLNDEKTKDQLLDHIYFKGLNQKSSRIIFKEILPLPTKNNEKTNLSDHYGVEVIFN